nr:immunoglobulin heavy chain junction region [Homo sapiens]
LSQLVFGIL